MTARRRGRKEFQKLAARSQGGLVLRGLPLGCRMLVCKIANLCKPRCGRTGPHAGCRTEPWLSTTSWSKEQILERFGLPAWLPYVPLTCLLRSFFHAATELCCSCRAGQYFVQTGVVLSSTKWPEIQLLILESTVLHWINNDTWANRGHDAKGLGCMGSLSIPSSCKWAARALACFSRLLGRQALGCKISHKLLKCCLASCVKP